MFVTLLFLGLALGGVRAPWAWTFAAVLLWAGAARTAPDIRRVPAWPLWGAFLAWTALSGFLCAEPFLAWPAVARTATMLLVLLCAVQLDEGGRKLWLALSCGAGAVLGLAALALPVTRCDGSGLLYPHYNYTAAVLAAGFAAALGAWDSLRERGTRAALGTVMAFTLGVMLWEHSRGALLASGAAALFWMWRHGRRRLLAAVAIAGLALTAVLAAYTDGGLRAALKLDHPAAAVRPLIWKAALEVAADHPLLGEGPGGFGRGFLRHNFPAPPGSWTTRYGLRSTHAHSEFLQTAAETGIPGLLLLLAALGAAWRAALRPRAGADAAGDAGRLAFIALFTQAVVDNVFALPAIGWLHYAALGVAVGAPPDAKESAGASSRAFCFAGLALAATAWWPGWALGSYRGRAFAAPGLGGYQWMSRALALSPRNADLWEDLARLHMRQDPPAPRLALAALAEAEQLSPTEAAYPLIGAEIAAAEGNWQAALALAQQAIGLEPRCLQARLLRAHALHALGDDGEASQELVRLDEFRAMPIPPNLPSDLPLLRFDAGRLKALKESLQSRCQGSTCWNYSTKHFH
ncbi:MAG: hypothetical protein A2X36_09665 [Elusimicrobia bacterium GWA2_69_24]|nr:MAG: hypothetical protein A2X36_09665 [Elusimicrobia bacterium GWA2_69_24]HBL15529.1 hypothetical protein [Elusimicrobiota bacterium]